MTIGDQVRAVIASELCIPDDEIKLSASFVDMGADSMDLQSMILSFEEELGIEIPADDSQNFFTPQDVIDYVDQRSPRP